MAALVRVESAGNAFRRSDEDLILFFVFAIRMARFGSRFSSASGMRVGMIDFGIG